MRRRAIVMMALVLLSACGPKLGDLERGETGRVTRAYNGDTLELDSGLRVFLAEVDAPRGEDAYAAQAQGDLEALALHREVLLAYGGVHRWTPRPRDGDDGPPQETAIAHVFVKSEGGRWFWLQHELTARGDVYVRPRRDSHARSAELLAIEERARAAENGLWGQREHQVLSVRTAATAALAADTSCTRGVAPFRIVEARVERAQIFERRAALRLDGASEEAPFSAVVFGDTFANWDGPALAALTGARIRVRGALGVFHGEPQVCLDHGSALQVLDDN